MCAGMPPGTETGVQFSRIRTQVRQVVVRHMWALPRFFFEICYPNGSSGHSQRSYPGKEGRKNLQLSPQCTSQANPENAYI